jgi:primosomal replication protein N
LNNLFFITATIKSMSEVIIQFDKTAVVKGFLHHESDVLEAGMLRHINIEIPFKIIGKLGWEVNSLHQQNPNKMWDFKGFWALKHYKNKYLIYHIQDYKK